MEIFDERELTIEERAAIADEPRPGAWIERDLHGLEAGDGRLLTQEQTDAAIHDELVCRTDDPAAMTAALGEPRTLELDDGESASQQRGGIHSDPLARLLAYRLWGERDRAWRKRDTARTLIGELEIEYLDMEDSEMSASCARVYGFDKAVAKLTESSLELSAQRGGKKAKATCDEEAFGDLSDVDTFAELYLDLFDELDRKLPAGTAVGKPEAAAKKAKKAKIKKVEAAKKIKKDEAAKKSIAKAEAAAKKKRSKRA